MLKILLVGDKPSSKNKDPIFGLQARIILHEIDHLNGLTFLER